jgi:hypothetical protein
MPSGKKLWGDSAGAEGGAAFSRRRERFNVSTFLIRGLDKKHRIQKMRRI